MKKILGKELIPISTLEGWSDKRLLRYYKTYRNILVRTDPSTDGEYAYDEDFAKEWKEFQSYIEDIKLILNKRNHVE